MRTNRWPSTRAHPSSKNTHIQTYSSTLMSKTQKVQNYSKTEKNPAISLLQNIFLSLKQWYFKLFSCTLVIHSASHCQHSIIYDSWNFTYRMNKSKDPLWFSSSYSRVFARNIPWMFHHRQFWRRIKAYVLFSTVCLSLKSQTIFTIPFYGKVLNYETYTTIHI